MTARAAILMALSACLLPLGASRGAEAPNILILSEDAARAPLPRDSRVHRALRDALAERFLGGGYAVYDETAVGPGLDQGKRARLTDAAIIAATRAGQGPPLDVAVIFSLAVEARRYSYTTKVAPYVTGRLLNLGTGKRIGGFDLRPPRPLRAPRDCDRACVLGLAERGARALGRDLGERMTARLDEVMATSVAADRLGAEGSPALRSAYTLVFDGFSAAEVSEMEEYLVVFSGYAQHRPRASAPRRHEYWYETKSPRGRLNRNLTKMLAHLNLRGEVNLDGNTFTLHKVADLADPAGAAAPDRRWDDW